MPVIQYKCPNCGGPLTFDASGQDFGCEFCQSHFTEAQLKNAFPEKEAEEPTRPQSEAADAFAEHTSLYSCPSCGAQIMAEDTTAATFCYYCHGPVILSGRLSGEYRPSKVIPFRHDKEAALDGFKAWRAKKWFVPGEFKSGSQLEKIAGVYIPFWLADCRLNAGMHAIGKKIRTWVSGDYQYTETREFDVRRRAFVSFHGIPADGSSKTDDRLMEAIEPFNYREAKDFTMSYLSGYLAEKYDVQKEAVLPRIRERSDQAAAGVLRDSISGYSSVVVSSTDISFADLQWQYVLLPVWLLTYKHKDKNYFFAMNGQTGKMVGIPPLSIPKMLGFAGILMAAVFLFTLLGGLFL